MKFLFQARTSLHKRKGRGSPGYRKLTLFLIFLLLLAFICHNFFLLIHTHLAACFLKGNFKSLTKTKAVFLTCQWSEPDVTATSALSERLFQRPSASKLSMNVPCFYSGSNQKEQEQQPLFRKMRESERGADNRAVITHCLDNSVQLLSRYQ